MKQHTLDDAHVSKPNGTFKSGFEQNPTTNVVALQLSVFKQAIDRDHLRTGLILRARCILLRRSRLPMLVLRF